MAIQGVFASDSGIVGDPKGDFASALLVEMPNGRAPLFALSSGMPSRNATDTIITWFEEKHLSGRTTLSADIEAADATIPVVDGSFIVPGAILMIETTGEYVYVTATAGDTLTVQRGFGGTTAEDASEGDGVQRLATAQEEGSDKPIAVTNLGDPYFNFTQIFRNTWNLTGTAKAVQYYTGSKVAKTRRDAGLFHSEDIERALIWGKRTHGVKGGKPFRTMDGLNSMIKTNVTAAGGSTSWTQLDNFIRPIFEKNIQGKPNERIAFCGNTALSVINGIARLNSTIFIEPGQTDFGLNINVWITPYGRLTLMTHPLMVESPYWTKDLYVYHPGAIELAWLRRTNEDDNDQNGTRNGADADYGVITSELTAQYGVELTGGRLTGLTAAAAG